MIEFSLGDLNTISPSLMAFAFGLLILLDGVLFKDRTSTWQTGWTAIGLAVSMAFNAAVGQHVDSSSLSFSGMVAVDGYGVLINYVILLGALGALFIGHDYLKRVDVQVPEYGPLLLFAVSGMTLLSVANDLILLFVALELMSVSLYVLCAINRGHLAGVEGAAKYLILGAFAAAILLYGIAFVYGAVGTTRLDYIGQWLSDGRGLFDNPLLAVGFALMVVGFGFKIAAAPFHMWSPDVYQGAPTPITAFMATAAKAASFAAFGRVLVVAFLHGKADWTAVVWGLSALTILWGNLGALIQTDLKRILAYSSVGHAGYLLMAFVGLSAEGVMASPRVGGLLFYLLSYTVMTIGAFSVLSLLTRNGEDDAHVDRLAGLAAEHPWIAAGLSLCLVSLAGIPPTIGFVGKFYLFAAAVEGGYPGLAVIGAIGGAVGVYYYLRPIIAMYMRPATSSVTTSNTPAMGALMVACVLVLVLGVYPGPLVDWCRAALQSISGVAGI